MANIKIGDKVRNKQEPSQKGTVVISTFGASVTGYNEDYHFQTIGAPLKEVAEYWEKDVEE